MATEHLKAIDITDIPDLLRIAEEVRDSNEARILKRDDEDIAVLKPVARKGRARSSKADYEAFVSAAGSWKGLVDADAVKEEIKASRGSDRASVSL